jgi:hypothetical protein
VLGGDAQPDEAAPVLADDGDAVEAERVVQEGAGPLDVPGVGVVGGLGGLVGAAEPDEVGGDRPQTGRRELGHDVTVEERPGGLAVQEHHRLAVGGPGLDIGHPQPVADLGVTGLVGEVGQAGEAVVGRTQNPHRTRF